MNAKRKALVPDEFRMSAAEFDKAMRGALSAPPPKKPSTKKSASPKKRKKRASK